MASEKNIGFLRGVFAAIAVIASLVGIYEFILKDQAPQPPAKVPVTQIVPVTQVIAVTRVVPITQVILATRTPTSSNATVGVFATQGWQDSGIVLASGEQFRIEYVSGRWTETKGELAFHGPEGSDYICSFATCCEPLPDQPKGALIGALGAKVFLIRRSGSFTSGGTGVLLLRMNDCDDALGDNAGSIVVRIER
ncbi:MAG: hypothetical protein HY741_28775 [Chloroflexi bacterium]|nr:hypothetical protein [Chloroflexota bacterium]